MSVPELYLTDSKRKTYYSIDKNKGLTLSVEFEYPKELHDLHKSYPLAPEKRVVNYDDLSFYSKGIPDKFKFYSKMPKLMTTVHNRDRYILHPRNLEQYINNVGVRRRKVHRALEFEECWRELKPPQSFRITSISS